MYKFPFFTTYIPHPLFVLTAPVTLRLTLSVNLILHTLLQAAMKDFTADLVFLFTIILFRIFFEHWRVSFLPCTCSIETPSSLQSAQFNGTSHFSHLNKISVNISFELSILIIKHVIVSFTYLLFPLSGPSSILVKPNLNFDVNLSHLYTILATLQTVQRGSPYMQDICIHKYKISTVYAYLHRFRNISWLSPEYRLKFLHLLHSHLMHPFDCFRFYIVNIVISIIGLNYFPTFIPSHHTPPFLIVQFIPSASSKIFIFPTFILVSIISGIISIKFPV